MKVDKILFEILQLNLYLASGIAINKIGMRTKLLTIAILVLTNLFWLQPGKGQQITEWQTAKTILLHEPGQEIFPGLIHPQAALFEGTFSLSFAQKEHQKYRELLNQNQIKTILIKDVLLKGTIDESGNVIKGEAYDQLLDLAKNNIQYNTRQLVYEDIVEQRKYFDELVQQLHPEELVNIMLQRPEVILTKTNINTGFSATYKTQPLMNLYFTRDQAIVTNKGVVLAKMNSVQRQDEVELVKVVYQKLGIPIVYEVSGANSFLEGGDFMMAGNTALIAAGLRTNAKAIQELLDNDVFGTDEVIVVKEKWNNQQQMHLDTYFNFVSQKLAVIDENRLGIGPDDPLFLACDMYRKNKEGKYQITKKDESFVNYLLSIKQCNLVPVPIKDQKNYGINFLTISPGKIIVNQGISKSYTKMLKRENVEVIEIDFTNLKKGFGAAHCITQVIERAHQVQNE